MNNTRINELKKLIEKSQAEFEKNQAQMEYIRDNKKDAEENLKFVNTFYVGSGIPRILTRKQLKALALEQQRIDHEKKELLRKNIDAETEKALTRARRLREETLQFSGDTKRVAEIRALNIEIKAFEHEFNVKNEMLKEYKIKAEDLIAKKIVCESQIDRLERAMVLLQKRQLQDDNLMLKMKQKAESLSKNRSSILNDYSDIDNKIKKIELRFLKSNGYLYECRKKLANYT